jgi:PLD-like domain
MMQAVYGNGWTCIDVAAEIIKTVLRQYPIAAKLNSAKLRDKVSTQIRVSYLRGPDGASTWPDSKSPNGTRAFHAKHFIVDDRTFYVGSQNLCISDLAEWGVVVDNADSTQQVLKEFWSPLWKQSYRSEDCNVQEVMDGLRIGRNGESPIFMSASTRKLLHESVQTRQSAISSKASAIIAATRVLHAFRAESADEDVEVSAPLPHTTTAPAAPEKKGSKEGDATRRFRALGHIAVLAQSQPPIGLNNQDLYYADDEEAELRVDDDEGPAPADIGSSSPLANITALKYLTKHRLRRNSV